MKHLITSLFFVLLYSNDSTAQITHAEFEWQVVSWIREARTELQPLVEHYEHEPLLKEKYIKDCLIDGKSLRKSIDTLLSNTEYNFVTFIYTKMKTVVPNKPITQLNLAILWDKELKELERIYLNINSFSKEQVGYINPKEFRKQKTAFFREEILQINDKHNQKLPHSLQELVERKTSRWIYLIEKHHLNSEACYIVHSPPIETNSKEKFCHWNKKQFGNALDNWFKTGRIRLNDLRKQESIKSKHINVDSLRNNLQSLINKSNYSFVKHIYQEILNQLPKKETKTTELIELWEKSLKSLHTSFIHSKDYRVSSKEIRQIKHIRYFGDILDVEPINHPKEAHELKVIWVELLQSNMK